MTGSGMDNVRAYHERSKHQLERYAPGPGGLDWATQPDPFRRYEGAPLLELPLLAGELSVSWDELFAVSGVAPQAFNAASVGGMLELSLGLSAWKSWGCRSRLACGRDW